MSNRRLAGVCLVNLRVLMEEELTKADKIKEKIKFKTEVLRLTAVSILAIGGGMVSMIRKSVFSGKENFLIASALILLIFLLTCLLRALMTINKTLK